MKKVLIIETYLPQYRKDFFNQLKEILNTDGIELELICGKTKGSDNLKKDEIEMGWVKYIPNKTFRIGKTELLWQPFLKELNDKDLVIVDNANTLLINYYLMVARHFAKYKLAFWSHVRNRQSDVNSFRNRYKYLFIKKCDWWFAYTSGEKQFLVNKNFMVNKITVVQNAIDTFKLHKYYINVKEHELDKLKVSLSISGNHTAIYCGAMYPEKRLDFILETCFKVKNKIPDFSMIFIGSGIEAYKIIEASQINNWIHYLGTKFGEERVKYFKISMIQIMPGAIGLGILDSFAMETPIVTTENPHHGPEIEYLENGTNGIIVEDNLLDYSQVIIDIFKTEKYNNLIEGCKISTEKYTIARMVDNFRNGIKSCLNSSKSY